MNWIMKLKQRMEKINSSIYTVGSMFIVLLAVLTLIDVSGRYFFRAPLQGALEITEMTMATIVFLSLAYSFSLKAHIRVDFVVEKFGKFTQRLLEIITSSLVLTFLIVLIWQGTKYAFEGRSNYTDVLHIPTLPIALLIPAASALSSIFLITKIVVDLHSLVKGGKEQN